MRLGRIRGAFVGAAAICACAGLAQASTVEKMSLEDMVAAADAAVVGEAVGAASVRKADGSVVTLTRFRIVDSAFGPTGGEITVETPGGAISGAKFRMSEIEPGAPTFFLGAQSLLFLEPQQDGAYTIVGFFQGAAPVAGDAAGAQSLRLPGRADAAVGVREALSTIRAMKSKKG